MPIIYETEQQELIPKKEENLLDLCLNNGIEIDHSCEGGASCGTCRIIVTQGSELLHPRNPLEQDMADDRKFSPKERLACQTALTTSFSFYIPKDRDE